MAANDFLGFASGGGANVVTQADWAALLAASLAPGFEAGIAPSIQLNKAWRQSSLIAAAVAQAVADYAVLDMLDDGAVTVAGFQGRIATMLASAGVPRVIDSGAADAYVGSTKFPAFTALAAAPVNFSFVFVPTNTNTGAATLNMGFGVKALRNAADGALVAGDFVGASAYLINYNSTNDRFRIITTVASTLAASAADVRTGTSATKFDTPAALLAALGFSNKFTSSDQTITNAGVLTIAHGIGRIPIVIQAAYVNQIGEANYIAGDVVPVPGGIMYVNSATNNGFGFVLTADATNLIVRFGDGGQFLFDKSTGHGVLLTNADWKLRLFAFG